MSRNFTSKTKKNSKKELFTCSKSAIETLQKDVKYVQR